MKKSWLLALLLAACTGTIGPTGQSVSGSGGANGNGSDGGSGPPLADGSGASGATGGSLSNGDGGSTSGGPSGSGGSASSNSDRVVLNYAMGRLTNAQYLNSLHDLFPTLALAAPDLPPETAVDGFNNAASSQPVAALNIEDYANAAATVAAQVKVHSADVFGCKPSSSSDEKTCLGAFLSSFGKRAYRRPLTTDENKRFTDLFQSQRSSSSDFATAASTVVEVMLQAPSFLYRLETGAAAAAGGAVSLTAYELASRLAFFLTDAPPDDSLIKSAESGTLLQQPELESQARRLLKSDRAKAVVAAFHRQWLKLYKIAGAAKDPTAFPRFSSNLASLLSDATSRFVDYAFWQLDSLSGLLTDHHGFVNDDLAPFFGVSAPGSTQLTMVELDPTQRAGILTQPGLLTGLANAVNDSPVQRGVLVLNSFLCSDPPPPPVGVNTTPPDFDPKKPTTTRQRLESQHAVGSCAGCHAIIDGVGFAFENFDAVGGWRTSEVGLPVNAATTLVGTGMDGPVAGGVDLASKLATSRGVADCVAYSWTRYALGLEKNEINKAAVADVAEKFWNGGGRFSDLLVAITTSPAFQTVKAPN